MSPLPPPVAPPLLMARVAFPLGIWNVPVYTPSFSVRATELPFRVAVGTCPSAGATLLRYILQNPLKAGIVQSVSVYPWSSWGEYTGSVPPALSLCATNVVLKRMPLSDLQELVDAPLSDDVMILDIDDNPRVTIGDQEVRQYLLDHFQDFQAFKHTSLRKRTAQPDSPFPFRPRSRLPTNLPNHRSPLWCHPSLKQQTLTVTLHRIAPHQGCK